MASPEPFQPYRKVQAKYDQELMRILELTARQIRMRLLRMNRGVGGDVRKAQLNLTLSHVTTLQKMMWRRDVLDAAKRGVDAGVEAGESAVETLTRVAYAGLPEQSAQALVDGLRLAAASGLKSDQVRRKRELSKNVYVQSVLHTSKVEDMIRAGVISNLSAKELADSVYEYVSPTTPGGASYAAMRLARTEINNAFHERQLEGAKRPGVKAVKWNLSGSHRVPDLCNVYAGHDKGSGEWPVDQVPEKPHPQCFCFLTYVMMSSEEFLKAMSNGDLDAQIDRRTHENMKRLGTLNTVESEIESVAKYVPDLGTGTEGGNAQQRAQNLLNKGKTRAEIVASELKRGRPAGEADQAIDRVLIQFRVPSHVMARTGNGTGTTPTKLPSAAAVVKKTPPAVAARSDLKVSTPEVSKSDVLIKVEGRVDSRFSSSMSTRVKRVLAIQEQQVGSQINRIKAVNHGLNDENRAAFAEFRRAQGHINLRKDLASRERDVFAASRSGQKSHCGHDGVESTVAHECGHAFMMQSDLSREQLDKVLRGVSNALKLPTPLGKSGVGGIAAKIDVLKWAGNPANKTALGKRVSQYATTSIDEMIAEIWADFTMNPNPSPEIKKAGEVLREIMRELPG